jgi:hypothetical protein
MVRRRGGSRAALPWRRGETADDEDLLARLDEAELATRDFLDGRGVLAQPARLFGQPCVLGPLARQRLGQCVVLAPEAQHRQKPTIAGQRVEDDDDRDDHQGDVEQTAVAGAAAQRLSLASLGFWWHGRRHCGTKYTKRTESTTERFERFEWFKRLWFWC